MVLRPYQEEARNAVLSEWNNNVKKTLLVLPTGCGKTIVFAKITEDCVLQGKRVLILAHRAELLEQAADKLKKSTGLVSAVEKADESSLGTWYRVVVGSVQTLMREKRLSKFPRNYFGTIIIDEAHHCISDSYQTILNYFSSADVLGVTATPDRGDMKNLGKFFHSLAYEYTLPRAIKEGYLSPIKAATIPLSIDICGVSAQAGDYRASELGNVLEPYLYKIADEMKKYCLNRKTVVFLPLVTTSQKFCDILNSKGFKAVEINGNSFERTKILDDYSSGKYNVICNAMLLTEGWDCPAVDCVVVLRPTKVRSLYCQMVGRGTRLSPETGKKELLLLDFLWNTKKHELCRPASLICSDEETAEKMTEKLEQNAGNSMDLEDAQKEAEKDVIAEREQALATELEKMRKRKRSLVDPLQYELSIQDNALVNYVPTFGWECNAPTKKQLEALDKFGIFSDKVQTSGEAKLILDRLAKRRASGLSTPKQIRRLESMGFKHVGTWLFEDANKLIGRIAANNWHVPRDISPADYIPEMRR